VSEACQVSGSKAWRVILRVNMLVKVGDAMALLCAGVLKPALTEYKQGRRLRGKRSTY
jgi:hypothetical protein